MASLSTGMLLVFLISGAFTALAMMRVFTNILEHETELHDLRNRINNMQFEHQLYLARLHGRIAPEADVEIIEDDEESAGIEMGEAIEAVEAVEAVEIAADAVADAIEVVGGTPQAA